MKREMTTIQKTVSHIEESVEKNNVRANMTQQVIQFAHLLGKQTVDPITLIIASLPASRWVFERMIRDVVPNSFLIDKSRINITCYGAERDSNVFVNSVKRTPENCFIGRLPFEHLLSKPLVERSGVLFVDENNMPNQFQLIPNVVWADYCGDIYNRGGKKNSKKHFFFPLEESAMQIKDMQEKLNGKGGVYYVTYQVNSRWINGGRNAILRRMGSKVNARTVSEGIPQMIETYLKKHGVKNVHRIFNVVYGGGKIESTKMITLGFSVNLAKNDIKPVEENRVEARSKQKVKQGQVVYRVANGLLTAPAPRSRVTRGTMTMSDLSNLQKRRAKSFVLDMIKKGNNNEEILGEIHKKGYRISRGCLGSITAHLRHPTAWKNWKRTVEA